METPPESDPNTEAVLDDVDLEGVNGGGAVLGVDAAGADGASGRQTQRYAR